MLLDGEISMNFRRTCKQTCQGIFCHEVAAALRVILWWWQEAVGRLMLLHLAQRHSPRLVPPHRQIIPQPSYKSTEFGWSTRDLSTQFIGFDFSFVRVMAVCFASGRTWWEMFTQHQLTDVHIQKCFPLSSAEFRSRSLGNKHCYKFRFSMYYSCRNVCPSLIHRTVSSEVVLNTQKSVK